VRENLICTYLYLHVRTDTDLQTNRHIRRLSRGVREDGHGGCVHFFFSTLVSLSGVSIKGDRRVEGSSAQHASRIRSVYEVSLRSMRVHIWDMLRVHMLRVHMLKVHMLGFICGGVHNEVYLRSMRVHIWDMWRVHIRCVSVVIYTYIKATT